MSPRRNNMNPVASIILACTLAVLFALAIALPVVALEGAGQWLDTLRGAQQGGGSGPIFGGHLTPLGTWLSLFAVALFFAFGGHRVALEAFAADGTLPDSGGASEGPRIHARGMVYAGVLYCAGFKRYYEGPEAWHYYSHGWCRSSDDTLPNALLYGEGLDSFSYDFFVTPGSSCSDTALLLTNYVVRNHGEAGKGIWGKSSVGQTMRAASDGTYYEIQSHYDYMTPEDVGAQMVLAAHPIPTKTKRRSTRPPRPAFSGKLPSLDAYRELVKAHAPK